MLFKVLIISIIVIFLFWLYTESQFKIETVHYVLKSKTNLRILQISDLHNNLFGKRQNKIIKIIINENPDVIVFTGDMMNKKGYKNFVILLEETKNLKISCLYVLGNHEMADQETVNLSRTISQNYGIKLSDRSLVKIKDKCFYGLDDVSAKNPENYKDFRSEPILLLHRPEYIKNTKNKNYELVICGHMHGGQWRLPFFREGLVSPEKTLFPKYTAGYYKEKNLSKLIVSRGIGTQTLIPRIFNRPEITVIDLKK